MIVARPQAVLAMLCLALMQSACVASAEPVLEPAKLHLDAAAPRRILFVGNSYLYYNDSLHSHVRRIAAERGPYRREDYNFKSATISGASLSQHHLDSLLEPGRLGVNEPFELVILQGGSFEVLTEESREIFASTATRLNDKIRATGAETALYMTHAYVEPHERADPSLIDRIELAYIPTANALEALAIPVGPAFEKAYREQPDMPLHKDFDGTHPSLLGTYLAACVVYTSIYARPVAGIEYDYFGAVNRDDAAFLQRIADETVRDFYGRR